MLRRIFSLFATVVLIALLAVPASSALAGPPDLSFSVTVHANAEQLKLIKNLWGKPMTVAEYWRTVYPSEFDKIVKGMPKSVQKVFYELRWEWPPLPAAPVGSSSSQDYSINTLSPLGVYYDDFMVYLGVVKPACKYPGLVAYGAGMVTVPDKDMTHLEETAYLFFWDGQNQLLMDSCSGSNWGRPYSYCGVGYPTSTEGLYVTIGNGSFICPPRYPPYVPLSGSIGPQGSGWVWVDP